ncbi:putative RPM1-interacting protein 4/NOI4 [Helianthus annuus]|nr:putative RPM1-interacting protein 4/NOI4 [Helianthus annuus]KAJ0608236.1 putative RPM1-interacting protein 4/NOI4 [Helianthus annuus]KAJ0768302.1 putative RPM1-interacting protein 4/NOI4 [Helianthus annuus]
MLLTKSPLVKSSAQYLQDKGPPLPKFGDWDVNDPASAEGFTVIFNKARNEKKTGGTSDSPPKNESTYNKSGTATLGKPQSKKWFCCMA